MTLRTKVGDRVVQCSNEAFGFPARIGTRVWQVKSVTRTGRINVGSPFRWIFLKSWINLSR